MTYCSISATETQVSIEGLGLFTYKVGQKNLNKT
jgi:hypothetical protein